MKVLALHTVAALLAVLFVMLVQGLPTAKPVASQVIVGNDQPFAEWTCNEMYPLSGQNIHRAESLTLLSNSLVRIMVCEDTALELSGSAALGLGSAVAVIDALGQTIWSDLLEGEQQLNLTAENAPFYLSFYNDLAVADEDRNVILRWR